MVVSVVEIKLTRGISSPWLEENISKRAEGLGEVVPIPTFCCAKEEKGVEI